MLCLRTSQRCIFWISTKKMYIKREVLEKHPKYTGKTTFNMHIDNFGIKLKQNAQKPKDAMILHVPKAWIFFFFFATYVVCMGIILQKRISFVSKKMYKKRYTKEATQEEQKELTPLQTNPQKQPKSQKRPLSFTTHLI